jgi:hypothetical protein
VILHPTPQKRLPAKLERMYRFRLSRRVSVAVRRVFGHLDGSGSAASIISDAARLANPKGELVFVHVVSPETV